MADNNKEEHGDVLTYPEELLIELIDHAKYIRRYTGFVALIVLLWLVLPFLFLVFNIVASSTSS